LRPVVNFINMLHVGFSYQILAPKITKLRKALSYEILLRKALSNKILAPKNVLSYKKRARKMLMKLRPVGGEEVAVVHCGDGGDEDVGLSD
jgi:hypothetical protein